MEALPPQQQVRRESFVRPAGFAEGEANVGQTFAGRPNRFWVTPTGDLRADDAGAPAMGPNVAGGIGAPRPEALGDPAISALAEPTEGSLEEESDPDSRVSPAAGVAEAQPADSKISQSERIQLEEDNAECMVDIPMVECWRKYGSFGIRRLHTEEWSDIVELGYQRPDWMAHEKVQKRHVFNLTLPGTHNSATYDFQGARSILGQGLAFGLQTQHLSIYQQLELGVRAFDLRIAYEFNKGILYIEHGLLTLPLDFVLGQMRDFLEQHSSEVVLVFAKIGRMSYKLDERYRAPLAAEEADPARVPGEMVHRQLAQQFGQMLATYEVLAKMPPGESMENPRISSLVELNARVLYFWEGQQVLCIDRVSCQRTPGWSQPWEGLAFGWGMPMGERKAPRSGQGPVLEPGCLSSSWEQTKSAHPDSVVQNIRTWALDLGAASQNTPLCFPQRAPVPPVHTPTLLYWADAQVTLTEDENKKMRLLLGHAKSLVTRGEGFNLKSSAERTNYLLLTWLMKKDARVLFTRPNVIAHDFASPILVHRIVEAMQEQKDCGYAIVCKASGSCWAGSLLGPDQACRPEEEVAAILWNHARSKGLSTARKLLIAFCALGVVAALAWCCFSCRRRAAAQGSRQAAGEGSKAEAKAKAPPPQPGAQAPSPSQGTAAGPKGATTPTNEGSSPQRPALGPGSRLQTA